MPEAEFLAYLGSVGLAPVKPLHLPDGRIVRYRSERDKPGKRNAGAVLHLTAETPWGVAWHWTDPDAKHYWRAERTTPLTPAQRAALRAQIQATNRAREQEAARVRAEAAERAQRLWQSARPADPAHPYLVRKGIKPYGMRQLHDRLLVAARDVDGVMHTVQFISPAGEKKFLTGGRTRGCYFGIGRPRDVLLVAEGVATAASLYAATGWATAVAFFAGNLLPVAQALRGRFPRMTLVLCADNDHQTPGNPGLTAARQAAQAVGGVVAVPNFQGVAHDNSN